PDLRRHRSRPGQRPKGVRIHVLVPLWRVALMQGGLRHDYWPGWLCLDDGLQRYQQVLKGHVHGLDDDEQHVGFSLQRGDVLTRIVSSFTEATRVEKTARGTSAFGKSYLAAQRV